MLASNSSLNSSLEMSSRYIPVGLEFFFKHIYLLLLVIVGCIGNALVIIIFGQRAFRTTVRFTGSNLSVYPFLFYMAISDTMYLLILFCLWLSNYINVLHRPGICQLTLYLTYVCNFINAYYTVAFTAQRLFAVINPIRVSQVLSWYRSRCLALSIIAIGLLIYSYLLITTGTDDGRCFSRRAYRKMSRVMDIIDCIIVFLIPYLAIITMNTIILISLHRMKQNPHAFLFQSHAQLISRREVTRRHASRKMTKLLLTVSTAYLIICAPYASIHTWRLFRNILHSNPNQLPTINKSEQYALLIYHISFAMNFYIYIVFGSKFRRELKRLFVKSKQNFSHYFHGREFYEHETQLELTEKNSTMTMEYTLNTNLHPDSQQNSHKRLNHYCCYCCCQSFL